MIDRKVNWVIPPALTQDEPLLLFSSCDSGYLRYAISLIRSVDLYSPGYSFVLHIINPDQQSLERINDLRSGLRHTRLFVSREDTDLTSLPLKQKRAYYASARFPRLQTLLSEYATPVFSMDADSLVVNPIELDFSDKANAELIIIRRDQVEGTPEHLSIATGSIWFLPTPRVVELLKDVADEIDNHFENQTLKWFIDQIVFFKKMQKFKKIHYFNLKQKYADWQFKETSILWAGKGGRKLYDMRFFILQALLSDDEERRVLANQLVANLQSNSDLLSNEWMFERLRVARNVSARITLYIPRLDLPWKRGAVANAAPPIPSDDTIDLRLYWKAFTLRLANSIQRAGMPVDIIEVPAWTITRQKIEENCSALALIPHRCKLDFEDGPTPVMFYMQEFFRWVFVVNDQGWSAASSAYPVDLQSLPQQSQGAYDHYRDRLQDGKIGSKFSQPAPRTKEELLREGLIPALYNTQGIKTDTPRPYIFFPLQIPTDQSIRYFSDVSEEDAVAALITWARARDIAVVLKPHPANMKSMSPFERYADGATVLFSNANVHDLTKHASGVYTINSGVGFEALLQAKPVVTFGRVEYDCVTFNATLGNLDQAWEFVSNTSKAELENRYRRFVDWFLGSYAIDMSQSETLDNRFKETAEAIVSKAHDFLNKGNSH